MATVTLDQLVVDLIFKGSTKDLNKFEQGVKNLNKRIDGLARNFTLAGGALSAALFAVGGTILNFEKAMNNLQAVLNPTAEDMALLRDQAKEMGRTTAFSASQAAAAQTELAQAGFKVKEILTAMPHVLRLAAAGQLGMGEAATLVVNQLNAYGLGASEAQRVTDVLAKTASSASTKVKELGPAFRQVAPLTNALNISIEQTGAMLAQLRDRGQTAEQAGTGLRAVFARLLNPVGETQEGIEELGLSVDSIATLARQGKIDQIFRQFNESGITAGTSMKIFGQEAGIAGTILAGTTAETAALTMELKTAEGTAGRMERTQMQGLPGAIAEFKSALEGLQIELGESGLTGWIERAVNALKGFIAWLSKADGWVKTTIAAVLASGPVLLGLAVVLKLVTFALSGLVPLLKIAAWANTKFGISAKFAAIANSNFVVSIRLAAINVRAYVASQILATLWNSNFVVSIRLAAINVRAYVASQILATLWNSNFVVSLRLAAINVRAYVASLSLATLWNSNFVVSLRLAAINVRAYVASLSLATLWNSNFVVSLRLAAINVRSFVASLSLAKVAQLAGAAATGIASAATWAFNAALLANPLTWIVLGIVALIAALVLLVKHWDTVKRVVRDFFDRYGNYVLAALAVAMPFIGIPLLIARNWSRIVGVVRGVWDSVVGIFRDHWAKILAVIFPAVGLPILIAQEWDQIVGFVGDIWNRVYDTVKGWIEAIISFIREIPSKVREAVKDIPNMVTDAVKDIPVVGQVLDVAGGVADKAKGFLGGIGKALGFAEGGIVPGPLGRPLLATVHGGEMVLPVGAANVLAQMLEGFRLGPAALPQAPHYYGQMYRSSVTNRTVNINITEPIVIQTQATDAKGIAQELGEAIQDQIRNVAYDHDGPVER